VFDYDLTLKVMDYIEVATDGKLVAIFLSGMKVTV